MALQVLAQSSSSGGSSGQSGPNGSATGNEKKYCREVRCNGSWKGSANIGGCVNFFGETRCLFDAYAEVIIPYEGYKENCIGGTVWDDCNACQQDCVKSSGSTSS